jgi:30S ribosomal protein S31
MGKGDIKSRRGKIWRGSYGVRRPRKAVAVKVVMPAKPAEKKKSGKAK